MLYCRYICSWLLFSSLCLSSHHHQPFPLNKLITLVMPCSPSNQKERDEAVFVSVTGFFSTFWSLNYLSQFHLYTFSILIWCENLVPPRKSIVCLGKASLLIKLLLNYHLGHLHCLSSCHLLLENRYIFISWFMPLFNFHVYLP